jgi:hypothetical protein
LGDVTSAFGDPWDIAAMGRRHKWPRLLAYGDLELSVCRCRCRRVNLICVQTWRDVVELPVAAGNTRALPSALTHQNVSSALDESGCLWQPNASLTFGDQCTLTATPTGAGFTFEVPEGGQPVLNVMGLPGDFHECPAPARQAADSSR